VCGHCVDSDRPEDTTLTLGERLSSRAYLTFEQGLVAAANAVKLEYKLTPRLSMRVQAGIDSAVDPFYTFRFD
jgi:translocation and assembly module TamB